MFLACMPQLSVHVLRTIGISFKSANQAVPVSNLSPGPILEVGVTSHSQIRHIVLGCLANFSLFIIIFNLCACNFCEKSPYNYKNVRKYINALGATSYSNFEIWLRTVCLTTRFQKCLICTEFKSNHPLEPPTCWNATMHCGTTGAADRLLAGNAWIRVGAWVLGTHTRSTRVPNFSTCTRTQTTGNISTRTQHQKYSVLAWVLAEYF